MVKSIEGASIPVNTCVYITMGNHHSSKKRWRSVYTCAYCHVRKFWIYRMEVNTKSQFQSISKFKLILDPFLYQTISYLMLLEPLGKTKIYLRTWPEPPGKTKFYLRTWPEPLGKTKSYFRTWPEPPGETKFYLKTWPEPPGKFIAQWFLFRRVCGLYV